MSEYELKIVLKSDMCASSGYSYAGVIDSDICYDKFGIPYIPSRRIKGCLREVAEKYLKLNNIDKIFGISGQDGIDKKTEMSISDAYISDYDAIYSDLDYIKKNNKTSTIINQQNILEQFTTVKAQTRIDSDKESSKENSLRYTRSVNHYGPDGKELVFYSLILIDDTYKDDLEKCAKALRHMGSNRNRGLGNVKCELVKRKCNNNSVLKEIRKSIGQTKKRKVSKNSTYKFIYTLKTVAPIMLSQDKNNISETYIDGKSVIGYFASNYIKAGNKANSKEFENLFLKNEVIFSNLYPCIDENIYYPAPSYISRLKKTKKYVNNTVSKKYDESDNSLYNPFGGNQPKKLKGKYIFVDGNKVNGIVDVLEVEKDIIYHYRRKKMEKNDTEIKEQLYSLEAIGKNQMFKGEITGKFSDIEKLISCLNNDILYFGKSRNAQYGRCELVNGRITKTYCEKKSIASGRKIMVVLKSDALFEDENGFTVNTDFVKDEIATKLGIKYCKADLENKDKCYTEIEVKKITGYYGKWNLKRQALPAVCAGSCFEYKLSDELILNDNYMVGVKNGEGYGYIDILDTTNAKWEMEEIVTDKDKINETNIIKNKKVKKYNNKSLFLIRKLLLDDIDKKIYEDILTSNKYKNTEDDKISVTPTALGKLTLMLTESINSVAGDKSADAADKIYEELLNKIFKNKDNDKKEELKDKQKEIKKLLEAEIGEKLIGEDEKIQRSKYIKYKNYKDYENEFNKLEYNKEKFVDCIWSTWPKQFMRVLVELKYAMKGEA